MGRSRGEGPRAAAPLRRGDGRREDSVPRRDETQGGPDDDARRAARRREQEHAPASERAEKAGVADSPEYASLLERMKWATGMAIARTRWIASWPPCATPIRTSPTRNSLDESQPGGGDGNTCPPGSTPQFGRCEARRDEVKDIYRLKHAVHVAAQGGRSTHEHCRLARSRDLEMEAARSAAMQGGAYGGDVERELENRLVVVLDNGQRQGTGTKRPRGPEVWADAARSKQARRRAKQVVSDQRRGREHACGGLSRARGALFIHRRDRAMDRRQARGASHLGRAKSALRRT